MMSLKESQVDPQIPYLITRMGGGSTIETDTKTRKSLQSNRESRLNPRSLWDNRLNRKRKKRSARTAESLQRTCFSVLLTRPTLSAQIATATSQSDLHSIRFASRVIEPSVTPTGLKNAPKYNPQKIQ